MRVVVDDDRAEVSPRIWKRRSTPRNFASAAAIVSFRMSKAATAIAASALRSLLPGTKEEKRRRELRTVPRS
jgi:hypothetical protein